MKPFCLSVLLLMLVFSGCAPKIYKANDFNDVAAKHKVVAILPAFVTIQLRPNEAKRTSPEQLENNEKSTGMAIQEKEYGWFLRRSDKYNYTVKFQDVSKTNSLLKEANISYNSLKTMSKEELAKLLNVDAIISTSVRMDKPMNEGVAVALGVVTGVWGNTNAVYTTINIHEGQQGDLMWKYDYQASGSIGSSPENLVNALMRNASKKFPYNAKS